MQTELAFLKSHMGQMQSELTTLKAHVIELDRTIFDTKALVFQNIKVLPDETGPELLQKVKQIFQDLNFPISGIQASTRRRTANAARTSSCGTLTDSRRRCGRESPAAPLRLHR